MREEALSLKQMRAFFAVAKAQSVTGASMELNLSQPAVTQSISKLEAQLGRTLFSRSRTGSYLTSHGEILLLRIERFFRQIETALSDPEIGPPFVSKSAVHSVLIRMTLSQIQALIAVAEGGSFSEAARRLGISQPSLHRSARELEQILDRKIYHRDRSGIALARNAQELARCLGIALREVSYALDEMEAANGEAKPRICIGALPLARLSLLASAINDFMMLFPNAEVEIRDGRFEPLLSELRSGKVDILYGVLRCPSDVRDVEETSMLRDEYRVAVRTGHPLTQMSELTLEQLASFDWILPGEGNPRRRVIELLFELSSKKPNVRIVTSSIAAHQALLVSSDRITLLTESEVREQAHRLTVLPVRGLSLRRPEGIMLRKGWKATPAHVRFLQVLEIRTRQWVASRPNWSVGSESSVMELAKTYE